MIPQAQRAYASGPIVVGSVADLAELQTLAVSGLPDGAMVWVTSLAKLVQVATSTLALATNQVMPTRDPNRRWLALSYPPGTANPWGAHADFYVHPTTGSNEATGTDSAHPVADFAELVRRFAGSQLTRSTTVHVMSGGAQIVGLLECAYNAQFTIDASPYVTQLASGPVASWTAYSEPGNEYNLLTVTGIADWTPYVNKRVRVVSGPRQDVVLWVGEANPAALGLNVARVSDFIRLPNRAATAPQAGDPVVIEDMVSVATYALEVLKPPSIIAAEETGGFSVCLNALALDGGTGFLSIAGKTGVRYSDPLLLGCSVRPRSLGQLSNASLWGCDVMVDGVLSYQGGINNSIYRCLVRGSAGGSRLALKNAVITRSLVQRCALSGSQGQSTIQGPAMGVFDSPAQAISIENASRLVFNTGVCLGKGALGFGLNIQRAGSLASYTTFKPIVTGTAGDWCHPNQVAVAWALAPAFSTTWATGVVAD